jgi:hypothetical protein
MGWRRKLIPAPSAGLNSDRITSSRWVADSRYNREAEESVSEAPNPSMAWNVWLASTLMVSPGRVPSLVNVSCGPGVRRCERLAVVTTELTVGPTAASAVPAVTAANDAASTAVAAAVNSLRLRGRTFTIPPLWMVKATGIARESARAPAEAQRESTVSAAAAVRAVGADHVTHETKA